MVADTQQSLPDFTLTLVEVIVIVATMIPVVIVVAIGMLSYRTQWFRERFWTRKPFRSSEGVEHAAWVPRWQLAGIVVLLMLTEIPIYLIAPHSGKALTQTLANFTRTPGSVIVGIDILVVAAIAVLSFSAQWFRELFWTRKPFRSSEGVEHAAWAPRWQLTRLVLLLILTEVLIYLIASHSSANLLRNGLLLGYLAMLIGGLVAAGELVSRYRDAPFNALGRGPSFVYLLINAIAAGAAFLVIRSVPSLQVLSIGNTDTGKAIGQVILAGFGAMAVFRSSVFTARIGDKDVAVGPAVLLQAVVNAADAGVDRETATQRAPRVQHIMQHVNPDKAQDTLPRLCYSLLQSSMPADEYTAMKQRIKDALKPEDNGKSKLSREIKADILGLILANYMGESVLEEGVKMLPSEQKLVPKLTTGGDITATATDESGAVVEYPVSAQDHQNKSLEAICTRPSGSKFPIGKTKVTCVAVHDATGFATKESFTVNVEPRDSTDSRPSGSGVPKPNSQHVSQ